MIGWSIIGTTVILFIFFSIIPQASFAFELNQPWMDNVKITQIYASNSVHGNDLKLSIVAEIVANPTNFSIYRYPQYFIITLRPFEFLQQPPAKNVRFDICEGRYAGANPDELFISCTNKTEYKIFNDSSRVRCHLINNGKCEFLNYTDYYINVSLSPYPLENWKRYVLEINYTLSDFILRQGDYNVIWLNFPNLNNMNIPLTNYILLPLPTSVPKNFPDNARIDMYKQRWAFTIEGIKDIFIWYNDVKELETKDTEKNVFYMVLGAALGTALGGIIGFFSTVIYENNKKEINKQYKEFEQEIKRRFKKLLEERFYFE